MDPKAIDGWLASTAWDKLYWSDVRRASYDLKSDGCTGVRDSFVWTCLEHDIHYRMHKTIDGFDLTKSDADYIMRVRIQQCDMSFLKWPMSWLRWLGVAIIFKNVSNHAWEIFGGTKNVHKGEP